ncbi:hypothetical protein GCM10009535_59020 [Streptomyces thermocarboxydovorans]|uniref:Transcriptional regulator n=1 Tax=Streptomyces thermocarboxydovorans TaxID=59298 RepID=A0ABP3T258_9ACTN
MKLREARQTLVSALREKSEGLTRDEIQERFPDLTYEKVDALLRRFYHRYVVGLDCVTDPRQARWIA